MKKLLLNGIILTCFAAITTATQAQIAPNSLPPGEFAIPGSWTAAAPLTPVPTQWSATISWAITTPAAGPAGLQTYWYKVSHTGGGPLSPPIQNLKSSTLDLDPAYIYDVLGVEQFGQIDDPGNVPGQSWGADVVGAGDSAIRWSWRAGLTGYNQLTAGESVYLWVQSTMPAAWTNITLQNGTVGQTKVPAPAPVPEPMTMALVGMGLGVVGYIRKKS